MAAPASKNVKDLNGKWVINKARSDDTDPVLALQGVNWLTRKAVGLATVTQHTRYSKTDEGHTEIVIDQVATGGVKGTKEIRVLNWAWREHSDWLFGNVRGKSRYTSLATITADAEATKDEDLIADAKYLTEGWLEENRGEDAVVESYVENDEKGWNSRQIWGFMELDGERWFARKFTCRKGKEIAKIMLVYSWDGELN